MASPKEHLSSQSSHPSALNLTTPAFGGDWNPEQWDDELLERDNELMAQAGVTLVTLGVFSWARMEPSEGHYDLDWVEVLIDRLHDAGIDVDLATGTGSPPPAWMATSHPETLPVDAQGVRLGFGSRQQYDPSSPNYRERSVALAGELARRFGRLPAVVLWHVDNGYACHSGRRPTCSAPPRTPVACSTPPSAPTPEPRRLTTSTGRTEWVWWCAHAWEDYHYWQTADRRFLSRIHLLSDACLRDPFHGIGTPKQLMYGARGAWSRRITDEHRSVHVVDGEDLVILPARYHY